MVSDTAKAKFGQINEFYIYALFDVQTSRNPNISPKRTEEPQEKSRSDFEQNIAVFLTRRDFSQTTLIYIF